jgi:hypothetical protein
MGHPELTMAASVDQTGHPEAALPPSPNGGRNPLAPVGASDPNLALLVQATRDPSIDLDRLKERMALRKEVQEDAAKRAFYACLALAKGEFEPILKKRLVDYAHSTQSRRSRLVAICDSAHQRGRAFALAIVMDRNRSMTMGIRAIADPPATSTKIWPGPQPGVFMSPRSVARRRFFWRRLRFDRAGARKRG